jgi:uncharacterized protein YndB with AHSA1/START domain
MARYEFVTHWRLDAPIDAVFDQILKVENWPKWWRGVEGVIQLEAGDDDRVGSAWRYTWKSVLPYRLVFDMRLTRVQRPVAIDGTAAGELAGEGRWRLSTDRDATVVRYEWDVATTSRWMNLLAPLARPLFAWNHDVVMRRGGEGLARRLQDLSRG